MQATKKQVEVLIKKYKEVEAITFAINTGAKGGPVKSSVGYGKFRYYTITTSLFFKKYYRLLSEVEGGLQLTSKFLKAIKDGIKNNEVSYSDEYNIDELVWDEVNNGYKCEIHRYGIANHSTDLIDGWYMGCIPEQLKSAVGRQSTVTFNKF